MCVCNPSIRTPYCGKLGCEWPGKHKEGERLIHIPITVECNGWQFTHNNCGYTNGLVGDNFCGGCGTDFRHFWSAMEMTHGR